MLLSLLTRRAGPVLAATDRVRLRTQAGTRFVDLTDLVAFRVQQSGVRSGLVLVQSLHTTAAIAVSENEPLLLDDLEATLARLAPLPPDEPRNGAALCRALLLQPSASLIVEEGRLVLGRFQRVGKGQCDERRALLWCVSEEQRSQPGCIRAR